MTARTMDHPDPVPQPAVLTQPVTLERIARIASEADEPVSANAVARVIAAYHALQEGDPLGMARRDPVTKAVATRVEDNGSHVWRVNLPNGEFYVDTQPTLPWPVIE